jgi:hypothetical protein
MANLVHEIYLQIRLGDYVEEQVGLGEHKGRFEKSECFVDAVSARNHRQVDSCGCISTRLFIGWIASRASRKLK